MRSFFFLLGFMLCALVPLSGQAFADEDFREVQIADPFIELRSGPGRGYPIFHVVDRGEWIKVTKRKTAWFKVATRHGDNGWVHMTQLLLTLTPEGKRTAVKDANQGDFVQRRGEIGVLSGNFSGAQVITMYAGYALSKNVSSELSFSQALGNISSKTIFNIRLLHHAFPDWRVSPFFALGAGGIKTEPHTTLVQAEDRSDVLAHAGVGIKAHLTQYLMLRAEYNRFVVFSSDDYNEELKEWKIGLAFFY